MTPGSGNSRKIIVFSDAIRDFAAAFDEAKKYVPYKEKTEAAKSKAGSGAV